MSDNCRIFSKATIALTSRGNQHTQKWHQKLVSQGRWNLILPLKNGLGRVCRRKKDQHYLKVKQHKQEFSTINKYIDGGQYEVLEVLLKSDWLALPNTKRNHECAINWVWVSFWWLRKSYFNIGNAVFLIYKLKKSICSTEVPGFHLMIWLEISLAWSLPHRKLSVTITEMWSKLYILEGKWMMGMSNLGK